MSDVFLKVKTNYERLEKCVSEDIEKFEKLLINTDDDLKNIAYKSTIIRRKNYLKDIKSILNNIREPFDEDIEYRKYIMSGFIKEVEENIPDELHLCFHGCPIYTAKDIISDQMISSSVDRIGTETSYDTSDQVSVTTKDTIVTTLDGYSDVHSLNYVIPCGVVFVIRPKNDYEVESSRCMLITTVDFRDENRLEAILSTPENIDKLRKWCINSNLDSNYVHTFDEFVSKYKNKNVR